MIHNLPVIKKNKTLQRVQRVIAKLMLHYFIWIHQSAQRAQHTDSWTQRIYLIDFSNLNPYVSSGFPKLQQITTQRAAEVSANME